MESFSISFAESLIILLLSVITILLAIQSKRTDRLACRNFIRQQFETLNFEFKDLRRELLVRDFLGGTDKSWGGPFAIERILGKSTSMQDHSKQESKKSNYCASNYTSKGGSNSTNSKKVAARNPYSDAVLSFCNNIHPTSGSSSDTIKTKRYKNLGNVIKPTA